MPQVDAATAITRRELPKYTVFAHKIAHIRDMGESGVLITPTRSGFDRFGLSAEFVGQNDPCVGGFVVLLSDGEFAYLDPGVLEPGR